ncbi:MAG TPA: collagen-like protein, partial [Thermoleophilaceae bacterium]|nr:collagen-like protein [Thermoleophilaceae bacterium]
MRMLAHLKSNAVAYLALMIALGGTSYAAVNLPRNSVGPKQLKRNAVNSAKVKNRSLRALDFRRGQLPAGSRGEAGPAGPPGATGATGPPGPVFGAARVTNGLDPGTPEQIADSYPFTLPSGGPTYLRNDQANVQITCSSGQGRIGLWVDNVPVPDTAVVVPAISGNRGPVHLVATVDLPAGQHTAAALLECPTGSAEGWNLDDSSWTVLRL